MFDLNIQRFSHRENTPEIVTLGHDFLQNIWLPDFYIYDLKTFKVKETLKTQDGIEIQKTNSNDVVIQYYIQCEVGFVCPIDYLNFPFHSPTCELKITSPIETNETLKYKVLYFNSFIMNMNTSVFSIYYYSCKLLKHIILGH